MSGALYECFIFETSLEVGKWSSHTRLWAELFPPKSIRGSPNLQALRMWHDLEKESLQR